MVQGFFKGVLLRVLFNGSFEPKPPDNRQRPEISSMLRNLQASLLLGLSAALGV